MRNFVNITVMASLPYRLLMGLFSGDFLVTNETIVCGQTEKTARESVLEL